MRTLHNSRRIRAREAGDATPPATPEPPTKHIAWTYCPKCGAKESNSEERGGNENCWHCGRCGFVACIYVELDEPPAASGDVERLEVLAYQIAGGGPFDADDVRLERRRSRQGGSRWAVVNRSSVLNTGGEWEYEPIPSSRTDDYLARTRFDTPEAALLAYRKVAGDRPTPGGTTK